MCKCLITVAAALVTMTEASSLSTMDSLRQGGFEKFVVQYKRDYLLGSDEYAQRHTIFQERVQLMEVQNSNTDRLWTASISHLTDRTDLELESLYGWKQHGGRQPMALLSSQEHVDEREAATEIDWNNLTMTQNKRNQGGCGSCWAVATATMLEARHEAQLGRTRSFSAQQLVNCVPNPKECGGQGGCAGATVELAMKYAEEVGLAGEEKIPYTAVDGTCNNPVGGGSFLSVRGHTDSSTKLNLESWQTLPVNKALPLMVALLDGPVAISVAASDWGSYGTGVFNSCAKGVVINHAVTLMGYGEEKQTKYWNVRNSWGGSWGENGHIRLLRQNTVAEEDAHCGWDTNPADGIACKPYPDKQYVCGMCGMMFDSVVVKFKSS